MPWPSARPVKCLKFVALWLRIDGPRSRLWEGGIGRAARSELLLASLKFCGVSTTILQDLSCRSEFNESCAEAFAKLLHFHVVVLVVR